MLASLSAISTRDLQRIVLATLALLAITPCNNPSPTLAASGDHAPVRLAQAGKGFSLPSGLQGLMSKQDSSEDLVVSAEYRITADGSAGLLSVTAKLGGDWHIYSVTQPDGGPIRTKIKLEPSDQFELAGEFRPDKPPKSRRREFFDVPVEEHAKQVIWTAPIRIAAGVSPDSLRIRGKLDGQICQDDIGCVPLSTRDTTFEAKPGKSLEALPAAFALDPPGKRRTPPVDDQLAAVTSRVSPIPADTRFTSAPADGYRAGKIHATVRGRIEPAVVAPGDEAELVIEATPDAGWHIYAYAEKDPKKISKPMLITLAEPGDWNTHAATADHEPIAKQTDLPPEPVQHYYDNKVTWRVPISIPTTAREGKQTVRGMLGYQTCTDSRCDSPIGVFFETQVSVTAQATGAGAAELKFANAKYAVVAKFIEQAGNELPPRESSSGIAPPIPAARLAHDFDLTKIEVDETRDASTLYIMLVAFVGGFILNFMPCVLPVIGLKIVAFVQQAGENRTRIFVLNLIYALGMLTVFWLLATLAAGASLGWGEQFNYAGFTIPLLCVVFVMGLSFLGVWEIPIPGFVGSGATGDLAQREGLSGAFFKGVITTVLATPCSGPGLATALTWSATKHPALVYLVFTCMGLGMALPYLVIGAFPKLIRFIPKPGVWMDTFKQLMGFVLMGTVVYMFSLLDPKYMVSTLALMFSLWASCWWIGRLPFTATAARKATSWITAIGFSALIGWFAFGYKPSHDNELPWETFTMAALDEHVKARRTVLIDFTARWCLTCKALERSVLNTAPVRNVVDKNEVVTLVADWSDGDEEVSAMLDALGSSQVPVIAIFPAGDAYHPKKLAGAYTRGTLLKKLNEAGPSMSPRLADDSSARVGY
ncbi:MAG: thioredoxin family protein [Planctomycetales bacterium]|nr:thioredoxin family protein [Planctomycetales bacterium]